MHRQAPSGQWLRAFYPAEARALPRSFDILVVGAGTAGCVIASRLSEDPACRVGLLEAGGMPADPDIADPLQWPALQGRSYDWDYTTAPQAGTANRVHRWPRGRLVGGSSCLNAMAHVRGHKHDFDSWAEAAGKRWSYEGLLPGFIKAEEKLAICLPDAELSPVTRAFMASGRAMGVASLGDHNNGELVGTAANSLTIRNGHRVSAADAYLPAEVLARPNLKLLLDHEAEHLCFSGARATGIVAVHAGAAKTIAAGRIVLCAGAIATPLLLMRSGIGDRAILGAAGMACRISLAAVGRNLQDHLLALGNVYAASKPVPPSRLQHSESLLYLHSDDITRATGSPDIVLACVVAPAVSEQFEAPAYGASFSILAGVTHPTSRGTIRPGGPGRSDMPIIDPHYLETEHDRRTLRKAMQLARIIGGQAELSEWSHHELLPGEAVASDPDLDAFLARAAATHHHPAGTCRMGDVVDETLGVRGVADLFVADASVIPRLPSGPINAAVMAIAETWSTLSSSL